MRMDKLPAHGAKPEYGMFPQKGAHEKDFSSNKPPRKPPHIQQNLSGSGRRPLRIEQRHPGGLPEPMIFDIGIAVLMLGFDLAIILFSRYQFEQERVRRQETAHLQHELELLKAQIRPHFFMNMLNSIHGMVEINPNMAQEMIMELSRLMRYVLYEGARPYTTLHAEVEFIATYVGLMRKRYSNKKVNIALNLPEPLPQEEIKLPPLLFIVIIENAFKHGISYRLPSFIDISMTVGKGRIHFDCINSRFAKAGNTEEHHGIGLLNLKKRMQLLFDDKFSLTIEEQEHTYSVNLTIPYNLHK